MADRLSPSTKTLPFLGLWKLIDVWSLFSAVSESQLPGDRADATKSGRLDRSNQLGN